jgi:uncharacterized paraquat-inducible protein A
MFSIFLDHVLFFSPVILFLPVVYLLTRQLFGDKSKEQGQSLPRVATWLMLLTLLAMIAVWCFIGIKNFFLD